MMEALANDMYPWNKFYDEARLWIKSDCVVDRLAKVSLTNLPNIGWNFDCLSKILQGFRRIIGYDKINLKFSSLYTLRLHSYWHHVCGRTIVNLRLNGSDDYCVKIIEIDSIIRMVSLYSIPQIPL